jgi:hypothetical protein
MAQVINEIGKVTKVIEQNVLMSSREINNITVVDGIEVQIDIVKRSSDGILNESKIIPYDTFKRLESDIWKIYDEVTNP